MAGTSDPHHQGRRMGLWVAGTYGQTSSLQGGTQQWQLSTWERHGGGAHQACGKGMQGLGVWGMHGEECMGALVREDKLGDRCRHPSQPVSPARPACHGVLGLVAQPREACPIGLGGFQGLCPQVEKGLTLGLGIQAVHAWGLSLWAPSFRVFTLRPVFALIHGPYCALVAFWGGTLEILAHKHEEWEAQWSMAREEARSVTDYSWCVVFRACPRPELALCGENRAGLGL